MQHTHTWRISIDQTKVFILAHFVVRSNGSTWLVPSFETKGKQRVRERERRERERVLKSLAISESNVFSKAACHQFQPKFVQSTLQRVGGTLWRIDSVFQSVENFQI